MEQIKTANKSTEQTKLTSRKQSGCKKLSSPHDWTWPELPEGTDQEIQLKLKGFVLKRQAQNGPSLPPVNKGCREAEIIDSIFEQYSRCLRCIKKPWRGTKKTSANPAETKEPAQTTPGDVLTPEEDAKKKQLMSCLAVGAQSVVRALERDELCLVLVWRATQPPPIKLTILSLVASRGCPAVCLSELLAPVKAGWDGLTSLTALGIKKCAVDTDFDEFVEYVAGVSPEIDIPGILKFVPRSSQGNTDSSKTTDTVSTNTSQDLIKPLTYPDIVQVMRKRDSIGGVRPHVHKILRPVVDVTKYYRYRTDHTEKTFGDNFLQFDKDDTNIVEFVNNKPVNVVGGVGSIQTYSIASPVACVTDSPTPSLPVTKHSVHINSDDSESMDGIEVDVITRTGLKKKRKQESKGRKNKYKSVNIKELKQRKQVN